jgi:3',5'-cyclic AMP phosphodiesterase CpdA
MDALPARPGCGRVQKEGPTVFTYRTVFVSDVHLGFRGARAEEFAAFLKRIQCERIYLVGDIVDMWALRQRWTWPATHNQVVRRLLKLAKRGTKVIYVPGNHDDSLRPYAGLDLAGIRVTKQACIDWPTVGSSWSATATSTTWWCSTRACCRCSGRGRTTTWWSSTAW